MNIHEINAPDAPASKGYAQAMVVPGPARILHVSGQIPAAADGTLAIGFDAQARQCWANLEAQLRAGGMGLEDLVKVTVYLTDRNNVLAYRRIRDEVLGGNRVALTTVIAGLCDEAWLIEIDAVAAR